MLVTHLTIGPCTVSELRTLKLGFGLIHISIIIYYLFHIYRSDIFDSLQVWSVGLVATYANNAANFYVYCLSGSLFRKELMMVFRCVGPSVTTTTTTTTLASSNSVKK